MSHTDPTTATCIHCERAISWVSDDDGYVGWINPLADYYDEEWQECESESATRSAHEPAPLDVWLKFDAPDDEEASHEANIYPNGHGYVFAWYHTAVGMVTEAWHPTYAAAEAAAVRDGYVDYSS